MASTTPPPSEPDPFRELVIAARREAPPVVDVRSAVRARLAAMPAADDPSWLEPVVRLASWRLASLVASTGLAALAVVAIALVYTVPTAAEDPFWSLLLGA